MNNKNKVPKTSIIFGILSILAFSVVIIFAVVTYKMFKYGGGLAFLFIFVPMCASVIAFFLFFILYLIFALVKTKDSKPTRIKALIPLYILAGALILSSAGIGIDYLAYDKAYFGMPEESAQRLNLKSALSNLKDGTTEYEISVVVGSSVQKGKDKDHLLVDQLSSVELKSKSQTQDENIASPSKDFSLIMSTDPYYGFIVRDNGIIEGRNSVKYTNTYYIYYTYDSAQFDALYTLAQTQAAANPA